MKNINLRVLLSAICFASIMAAFTKVDAGPVRFDQVVQIINAQPAMANTGLFTQLHVAGDYTFLVGDGDDDKKQAQTPQDGRVITETTSDIVKDDVCDCEEAYVSTRGGFPMWSLLGLAAIPAAFVVIKHNNTPTPTQTIPITVTPTRTPDTPTPTITPTPPPTVPEPMTILLFGTGLASVGLAARRRYGKKDKGEKENEV